MDVTFQNGLFTFILADALVGKINFWWDYLKNKMKTKNIGLNEHVELALSAVLLHIILGRTFLFLESAV